MSGSMYKEHPRIPVSVLTMACSAVSRPHQALRPPPPRNLATGDKGALQQQGHVDWCMFPRFHLIAIQQHCAIYQDKQGLD